MSAREFLAGHRVKPGVRFTGPLSPIAGVADP